LLTEHAPQAKEMFDKAPDQYRVAYRGYWATGVAIGKKTPRTPRPSASTQV
jgi:hypothetical protein